MKRFTITYRTDDDERLEATIEATSESAAFLAFHRSHPYTYVLSIEEAL